MIKHIFFDIMELNVPNLTKNVNVPNLTKNVSEDEPSHCSCAPLIVGSEDEDDEEWEGEALGIEECLFCSSVSSSLENNLNHMSVKHGFFLPDADYLVDVEGMVTYLGNYVFSCKEIIGLEDFILFHTLVVL